MDALKRQRSAWAFVYEVCSASSNKVSLAEIEAVFAQAEARMAPSQAEHSTISALNDELVALKMDVDAAQAKLSMTQASIDANAARLRVLRAEAAALERTVGAGHGAAAEPQTAAGSGSSSAGAAAAAGAAAMAAIAKAFAPAPPAPTAAPAPAPQVAPTPATQKARRPAARANKGLKSTMDIEPALKEFWYPTEFSAALKKDVMVPFEMFGEAWVLFRGEDGKPACVSDACAHRACPLSVGTIKDGQVTCAYHGWRFNASGECTLMPSTKHCKNVSVRSLPVGEKDGFVWVWPGDGEPPADLPDYTRPPAGHVIHAEIYVDVPVEHGLLMENLLDLAHAPFTHTATFARGWPVPDAVKFHANRLLSGAWDPYPISMSFQPPCMVLSHIGLAQPGKIERGVTADQCERHLHQLHVCMPGKRGHTRLLYRMSLDFMHWVRHVPFIDLVWKQVAAQVLGEDLVLVLGQQDRLERGVDTWSFPVSYDKLAVRYRRWRNAAAEGNGAAATDYAAQATGVAAGEMFAIDEDEETNSCAIECATEWAPVARPQ
ncbi:hypothetical protein FOA52_013331 [Chlamydomonas sp. UWO 241]|nr:hypothetical protein FOA52_013331 [Chlamydomonas sp. UWO 241]